MVKASIVPAIVNGSDEIFSENVAFLRENIDNMFVLLMGAITCFLQVFIISYILEKLLFGVLSLAHLLYTSLFSELFLFKAGFGMLEAGSVRSKNTTNILTKNFGDLCLGVVAFCLVGYGLAFSEGNEWVGNEYFGLINLPYSLYPHVFMQVSHTFLKDCDNMLSSGCLCCYVHDNCFGRNSREDGLCRLPHHQVCASVFG